MLMLLGGEISGDLLPASIPAVQDGGGYLRMDLFFSFLGPHLHQMEVPRLGVDSELQLPPIPQPQQLQIQITCVTYTTAQGNAGSSTH